MPSPYKILYYALHPGELRSILQWTIWHDAPYERKEDEESETLKRCFYYLDMTSRSFSAVIKELNHELLVPICLFYLILRGLDTIEDDPSIALEEKTPLLQNFHTVLEEEGWTYDGNRPEEKDRDLLVNFHYVVTEFLKLKPEYKDIIKDICKKMGAGMAGYAHNAEFNKHGVNTIKDYERYCHYVAGLVGEGLTRLFVQGDLANPALLKRTDLHESMGQFLQQTNIIRDVREDADDQRRFWPREVWSKHVEDFDDLFKRENKDVALRCSAEMIAIALEKVPDCLFYLAGMKDQSVFNFAAIPQTMAIATLDLCFMNPAIFQRNIKISRGKACELMMKSSQNLNTLYDEFKAYARIIHKRADPRDPNFIRICVACGKIEQFVESIFPTQDPRAIIAQGEPKPAQQDQYSDLSVEEREKRIAEDKEAKRDLYLVGGAMIGVMFVVALFMLGIAWAFGARFDLMVDSIKGGKFTKPNPEEAQDMVWRKDRGMDPLRREL